MWQPYHFKLNERSEYRSPTLCPLMNHDYNITWDKKNCNTKWHERIKCKSHSLNACWLGRLKQTMWMFVLVCDRCIQIIKLDQRTLTLGRELFHCKADLQFNLIGFDETRKYVGICKYRNYRIQTSQTGDGDQLYRNAPSYGNFF